MENQLEIIHERIYKLFQKYGIKSVTMDDIAKELGISKKTLYQHFTDKRDLIIKIVDYKIKASSDHNEKLEKSKLNAVEELLFVYQFLNKILKDHNPSMMYDLRKYYPDVFEKLHTDRRDLIYGAMLHNLKKGQKEGLYRKDFSCDIIAKLHVFRVENMVDSDMFTQTDFESENVFRELFLYHLRGIASEKGIKIFEEGINKK